MPIETELKLRVESHEEVRRRLQEADASLIETGLETNRIYDRPDGSLRKRGCGLRLRSVLFADGKESRATLTFKGPRRAMAFKSREELEVGVDDADAMERLMEGIGFVQVLRYQKRRESWQLDECRVDLDEPARIGLFVEIEGPDERTIRRVQHKLKLDGQGDVAPTYVGMLVAFCKANGITSRTLDLP